MSRRRARWLVRALLITVVPGGAFLFVWSTCSRPGTPAPEPWLQHSAERPSIAISPDSTWLAFSDEGRLMLCHMGDRPDVRQLATAPDPYVDSLAFTHDSKRLVVCTRKLTVYSVPAGELEQTIVPTFRSFDRVFASPRDDTVAVIREYDGFVSSLEVFPLSNPDRRTQLLKGRIGADRLTFAPSGELAAAFDHDGRTFKLWRTADWSVVREIPANRNANFSHPIAFDASSTRIVIAESDPYKSWCRVLSTADGTLLDEWTTRGDVADLAFHPTGSIAALRKNYVINIPFGSALDLREAGGPRRSSIRVHESWARALLASPNGLFIATAGHDRHSGFHVKVWRWEQFVAASE